MAIRQTEQPVVPTTLQAAYLEALTTRPAGPLAENMVCRLWSDENHVPSPYDSVYTYATKECNFSNYEAFPLEVTSVVTITANDRGLVSGANYVSGGVGSGEVLNVVHGYYISGGDTPTLIQAERFAEPVDLSGYGTWLSIDLIIPSTGYPPLVA